MRHSTCTAREALAVLDAHLDHDEADRLELEDLRMVIDDIRAVMSVAPELSNGHLADTIYGRLHPRGTTDADIDLTRTHQAIADSLAVRAATITEFPSLALGYSRRLVRSA